MNFQAHGAQGCKSLFSILDAGSKVVFHKGKGRLAAGRGEALSSAKARTPQS